MAVRDKFTPKPPDPEVEALRELDHTDRRWSYRTLGLAIGLTASRVHMLLNPPHVDEATRARIKAFLKTNPHIRLPRKGVRR